METTKKNKLFLFSSLAILIVLLVIFVAKVRMPQQFQSKAQVSSIDQCVIDGGYVTDQVSCSRPNRQIVNVIGDSGGGDGSNIQVCCRTITVPPTEPPVIALSCPADSYEAPEIDCPAFRRVSPIASGGGDGGDGVYVRAGVVCCRPEVTIVTDTPTPPQDTPPPSPTPSDCPLPNAPEISNLQIVCPEGCFGGTQ